jgi:hypothetical protein
VASSSEADANVSTGMDAAVNTRRSAARMKLSSSDDQHCRIAGHAFVLRAPADAAVAPTS